MDIYQKIRDGEYANQLPYPARPREPGLPKPPHLMSHQDLDDFKSVVVAYEKSKMAYAEARAEYNRGEGEAIERFWADVAENEGIDKDDPFFLRMRSIAWEQGHSSGLNDVLCAFDELLPLWELYRGKK